MKHSFLLLAVLTALVSFKAHATDYYWNYGGTNTNWNTLNNWHLVGFSGSNPSVIPGHGDNVIVGNGSGNATITMNVSDTINRITIEGSGQIFINTSNSSVLYVLGNLTSTNANGTGGGSATIKMCGTSSQSITGGSTDGWGKLPNLILASGSSVTFYNDITMGGSTTLTHSSGTVSFDATSLVTFYYSNTITGVLTFNNVEFQGNAGTFTISTTDTITGNLTYSGSSWAGLTTGTLLVKGNVYDNDSYTATTGGPTGTIKMIGSNNDTIVGAPSAGEGFMPSITINKSGGTLVLTKYLTMDLGTTLIYTAGTLYADSTSSDVIFYKSNTITGNMTLWNVEFQGRGAGFTVNNTITAKGNLTYSGTSWGAINSGTVEVYGNIYDNNSYTSTTGATGTIKIKGGKTQTFYGTSGSKIGYLPSITINKSSGTIKLRSWITLDNSTTLTYTSGTIDADSSTVVLYSNKTVSGTFSLKDVEIDENASTTTINDTLKVNGNLYIDGPNWANVNTGTIILYGNLYDNNTSTVAGGGTATIKFQGGNDQSLSGVSTISEGRIPNVLINKSGGTLTLNNYIPVGTWTYTAGTVSAGTSTVEVYGSTINSSTMWFNNVNVNSSATLASVFKLTGNLLINSTLNTSSSGNYAVEVQGDFTNNGTYTGNNSTVTFSGGNLQHVVGPNATTMYNLVINKSASIDSIKKSLTITHNATFTSGNMVSTTSNLLIFNNGATVSGTSNSSFVSGPVKKIGNAAFRFPIGKGSVYNPLAISPPSTTSDAFIAEYFNTQSPNTTLDGVLTYIDPCEYWNLNHSAGSSSFHDTLFWNSPCFYIPNISYIKIGYVSGSTWTSAGTCTTSGTTTLGKVASATGVTGDIGIAKDNPSVYAHAGTDLTICNGSSSSTGASPSGVGGFGIKQYTWSPATGLSSSTLANPTAAPTTTTTYILTVSDSITEFGKDTVIVTVNPVPSNNTGGNKSICNGSSTTIGASNTSGHTYSWSPSTGLSSSTVSNPTAAPTFTTTYSLTETISATSCTALSNIIVTVNSNPVAHAGNDTTVMPTSPVTLGGSSTASGGIPPYSYSWKPTINLNDSTIEHPTASINRNTTYTVNVTDANGCSGVSSVGLEVTCENEFCLFNTTLNTQYGCSDNLLAAYLTPTFNICLGTALNVQFNCGGNTLCSPADNSYVEYTLLDCSSNVIKTQDIYCDNLSNEFYLWDFTSYITSPGCYQIVIDEIVINGTSKANYINGTGIGYIPPITINVCTSPTATITIPSPLCTDLTLTPVTLSMVGNYCNGPNAAVVGTLSVDGIDEEDVSYYGGNTYSDNSNWNLTGGTHEICFTPSAFIYACPISAVCQYVTVSVPSVEFNYTLSSCTNYNFSATSICLDQNNVTYTWNFGDMTGTYMGSSVSHDYASSGTYTVTVTASDGNTSAVATQTINVYADCCTSSGTGDVTVYGPITNVSSLLTLIQTSCSTCVNTTTHTVTGFTNNLNINGNLVIDESVTFIGCTNMIMGTDSKITVSPGLTLEIATSHLYPCDEMWDGIYEPRLIGQSQSNIILAGNTIEQSANGVLSVLGNPITAIDNDFKNCFRGIQIDLNPNHNLPAFPLVNYNAFSIWENTFEATGTYCLYSPIIYNTTSPQITTTGKRSQYGISTIFSGGSLVIGLPVIIPNFFNYYLPNHFNNLNCGIYVNNANVTSNGNLFENINPETYVSPLPDYNGVGIYAKGKGTLNVNGYGNQSISSLDNTFDNCLFAVKVEGAMSANINNNYMTSNIYGIYLIGGTSAIYNILSNVIDYSSVGISSTALDANSRLSIGNNYIEPSSITSSDGIYVSHNSVQLRSCDISYNSIVLDDGGNYNAGIDLWNIKSGNIHNNQVSVNGTVNYGISAKGCRTTIISNNKVTGQYASPQSSHINAPAQGIAFYEFGNNGDHIYCDTSANTYEGFESAFGESQMKFLSNNIGNHYNAGLFLDNTPNVGAIGFFTGSNWHSMGNIWKASSSDYTLNAALGLGFPYKIYVLSTPGNTEPPITRINGVNFIPIATSNLNGCEGLMPFPKPIGPGPVIVGLLGDTTDTEIAMNYEYKRFLFQELKDSGYTVSTGSTDTFQHFFDTASVGNLGAFEAIGDSMNAITLGGIFSDSLLHLRLYVDTLNNEIYNIDTILNDSIWVAENDTTVGYYALLGTLGLVRDILYHTDSTIEAMIDSLKTPYQARLVSLRTRNNALTTVAAYEQNEQTVNDIYIRNFMQSDSVNVSSDDMSTLWSIANQCPDIGGVALLKARGIITALVPGTLWNDDSLCGTMGARIDKQSISVASTPSMHLYPNPTNNSVNITFENNSSNGLLEVYDEMGKMILREIIAQNTTIFNLNTSELNDGNYVVKYTKDQEHWIEKLSVIH